jgi:hypothetical protein
LAEFWVAEPKSASLACCHVVECGVQATDAMAAGVLAFRQVSKLLLIEPNVDPVGNVRISLTTTK